MMARMILQISLYKRQLLAVEEKHLTVMPGLQIGSKTYLAVKAIADEL